MPVIHAIVDAQIEEDALGVAQGCVFDRLIGATRDSRRVFDYYITFDEDNRRLPTKEDGSEYPIIACLNSNEGQELLANGWNATKNAFSHNLEQVREALPDLSNKEVMSDSNLVRHRFSKLGAHAGPTIRLYDQYGNGIRMPEDFVWACRDLDQPWIVPAYAKY